MPDATATASPADDAPPPKLPGSDAAPPAAGASTDAPPVAFVMPEKFKGKTAEDIAKSYVELEKMKPTPAEVGEVDLDFNHIYKASGVTSEQIAEAYKKGGDDWKGIQAKLGKVKLKDVNGRDVPLKITPEMIDTYVGGQAAAAELATRETAAIVKSGHEAVGGEAQAKVIGDYLAQKDPTYLQNLQAQVNANPAFYPDAMRLMAIKHRELTGTSGSSAPIAGTQTPPTDSGGFDNIPDMRKAMEDARVKYGRWDKDPALVARMEKTPNNVKNALR